MTKTIRKTSSNKIQRWRVSMARYNDRIHNEIMVTMNPDRSIKKGINV